MNTAGDPPPEVVWMRDGKLIVIQYHFNSIRFKIIYSDFMLLDALTKDSYVKHCLDLFIDGPRGNSIRTGCLSVPR